jgi:hypothetical protein
MRNGPSDAPPDVSAVKGILSSYSFLFFGTPGHYSMRKYKYWCKPFSLVNGCGAGSGGNDTSCEKEFNLSHVTDHVACYITRGRIIGAHVSTNKTVFS